MKTHPDRGGAEQDFKDINNFNQSFVKSPDFDKLAFIIYSIKRRVK